ncbi:hypothetical protein QVD17_18808 [Tagetes erecta]|uniref:Uncharacterized protein n=1 Tax=Tagetes erecta TaxID=13708 RepID=A0AAD8KPU0_TARER|nr:hypothetical protein QVD17_18808 [Tagetes erecta]
MISKGVKVVGLSGMCMVYEGTKKKTKGWYQSGGVVYWFEDAHVSLDLFGNCIDCLVCGVILMELNRKQAAQYMGFIFSGNWLFNAVVGGHLGFCMCKCFYFICILSVFCSLFNLFLVCLLLYIN